MLQASNETASVVVPALMEGALRQHMSGMLAEAEGAYRKVLEQRPDHAGALQFLGMLRAQCGDASEGLQLLRKACKLRPDLAPVHYNMGIALRKQGDLEGALRSFGDAVDVDAGMTEAHLSRARILRLLGRGHAAADALREAIALQPGSSLLHRTLAEMLAADGDEQSEETAAHFRSAAELDQQFIEQAGHLGMMLQRNGRRREAAALLEQMVGSQPNALAFAVQLGRFLFSQRALDESEVCFRCALRLQAEDADALQGLGAVLLALNRVPEAIASFREVLEQRPEEAQAHADLAAALTADHQLEEAERCCREALARDFGLVAAHRHLGDVLVWRGRFAEAGETFARALELDPCRAETWLARGFALGVESRNAEAAACFRRALALEPESPEAQYLLASVRTFERDDDPGLADLEKLAAKSHLTLNGKAHISFALAKAYDDLDQYDVAIRHAEAANRLKRRTFHFAIPDETPRYERLMATFGRDLMQEKAGFGLSEPLPIFIVGFPRAGKSLLESVLAGISGVRAGGEGVLIDLDPDLVHSLTREEARSIATKALEQMSEGAPGAARITNTRPGNFMSVGLIRILFPGATIIHCVRDPIDTCLSCYFKNFNAGWEFTYDLDDLAQHYRLYDRLMRHWHDVLPRGSLLDVRYEDLIANPEKTLETVASFCGLRLDPTAPRLSFHTRGVHRWKRYEKNLDVLKMKLAGLSDSLLVGREI